MGVIIWARTLVLAAAGTAALFAVLEGKLAWPSIRTTHPTDPGPSAAPSAAPPSADPPLVQLLRTSRADLPPAPSILSGLQPVSLWHLQPAPPASPPMPSPDQPSQVAALVPVEARPPQPHLHQTHLRRHPPTRCRYRGVWGACQSLRRHHHRYAR